MNNKLLVAQFLQHVMQFELLINHLITRIGGRVFSECISGEVLQDRAGPILLATMSRVWANGPSWGFNCVPSEEILIALTRKLEFQGAVRLCIDRLACINVHRKPSMLLRIYLIRICKWSSLIRCTYSLAD